MADGRRELDEFSALNAIANAGPEIVPRSFHLTRRAGTGDKLCESK